MLSPQGVVYQYNRSPVHCTPPPYCRMTTNLQRMTGGLVTEMANLQRMTTPRKNNLQRMTTPWS